MHPALGAFIHPVCLSRPRRLTDVPGWHEHIPFAMNLVAALRPARLVELGTHRGDSYCAFCQAVAELSLPTRCHAIDTWEGDEHSGRYGPEVLAELRAYHDGRYGSFSTLVHSTFEQARGHFGDGEIDLLHVDGYHTYETASADLEAWLPKMSQTGVVLLHDIDVRERGFGVWRLWEELAARWPHFAFVHGHGLGVLAVGGTIPDGLRPLLEAGEEERLAFRTFYAELGWRVAVMREAAAVAETLAGARASGAALTDRVAALEQRCAAEGARKSEVETQLRQVEGRLRQAEEQARALRRERDALAADLARTRTILAERDAALASSRVWQLARRWWRLRDALLDRPRDGR